MTPNDIFYRLCDIDRKAQSLISEAGFDPEDGFADQVRQKPDDPEELFLLQEMEDLLFPLAELHDAVNYLKASTHGEFRLQLFPDERYGYVDSHGTPRTFTCGTPIEAMIPDRYGRPCWVRTRIEHDGNDFFLWGHGSVPLQGLAVRERW